MSQCFTGVALEIGPGSTFVHETVQNRISMRALLRGVHGIRGALTKIFCFSLFIETITLMMPVCPQLVMDHPIPVGDNGLITLNCAGLMIFILLRGTVSLIRAWSTIVMETLINVQWQSGLFRHLLHLPLAYFERRKLGDIQSRIGSLDTLGTTFTIGVVGAIMDSIMVVCVLVMLVLYGGWLTAVVSVLRMSLHL